MKIVAGAAGALVALSMWGAASAGVEPARAQAEAMATFAQAQRNVAGIDHKVSRLIEELKKVTQSACGNADAANSRLLGYTGSEPAEVAKVAEQAHKAQAECDVSQRRSERLARMQGELRQAGLGVLRLVALDVNDCKGDESLPCQAELLKGVVSSLATSLHDAPEATLLVASKNQLVEAAAKAQELVATARAKAADAYAVSDAAAAKALAGKVVDNADAQGRELREAVRTGIQSAAAAREAVSDAQKAANVLVGSAVELAECKANDAVCIRGKDLARLSAALAQTRLRSDLARAEEESDSVKQASWSATAASEHSKMADRRKSVAFARLLDTYPDARSLVGDSSGGQINASHGESSATIKYSIGKTRLLGSQQHALTLTTPIGSDGFARTPQSLAYSTYWLQGVDSNRKTPIVDLLWVGGLSPKVSYSESSYYDKARFGETISTRQRAWSLSAFLGLYRMQGTNPGVHLLEVELKREPKPADEEFRCAVPASAGDGSVKCLQGAFGPPEKSYSRLYKYQLRTEWAKVAFSPTLSYNDGTKETRLEVPIYFIRPEGKDQPFNAGIKLDWGSKSRDRIGIFVGTNFDLYGLPGQ